MMGTEKELGLFNELDETLDEDAPDDDSRVECCILKYFSLA